MIMPLHTVLQLMTSKQKLRKDVPFSELTTLQLTSHDQLSTWVWTERQASQFTREFPVSSLRITDTIDKITLKILQKFAMFMFTSVILNGSFTWSCMYWEWYCIIKYLETFLSGSLNVLLTFSRIVLSVQIQLLPPANQVWGKVMFSEAFVCPQGVLCMISLPAWPGGSLSKGGLCPWGLCPGGGSLFWGVSVGGRQLPYGKERAVHILLECILVGLYVHKCLHECLNMYLYSHIIQAQFWRIIHRILLELLC